MREITIKTNEAAREYSCEMKRIEKTALPVFFEPWFELVSNWSKELILMEECRVKFEV